LSLVNNANIEVKWVNGLVYLNVIKLFWIFVMHWCYTKHAALK